VAIPDWYQTIAEIAIGLAGFSGLAVALRRDTGPLSDIQKFRMSVLFGMAFGALFLSLVPHVLATLGVSDELLWGSASLAMVAWSLFFMYMWILRSRRIAKSVPEIFNRKAFAAMTVGHIVNLLLQAGVAFAWFESNTAGVFGLGLIWYLIHGSQQFVRMLFIQPRDENGT
jgi:hypothetical protein